MAKFKSKRTFYSGNARVEVGTKGGPAVKIWFPETDSAFITSAASANDIADALDDALDAIDSDPLLWGDGSR